MHRVLPAQTGAGMGGVARRWASAGDKRRCKSRCNGWDKCRALAARFKDGRTGAAARRMWLHSSQCCSLRRRATSPAHPVQHPPGVLDTMASEERPVSRLMRLLLPTFDRPMTGTETDELGSPACWVDGMTSTAGDLPQSTAWLEAQRDPIQQVKPGRRHRVSANNN